MNNIVILMCNNINNINDINEMIMCNNNNILLWYY